MKTETMKQKIIPFAVGIVWTCAVCVAMLMFSVCSVMSDRFIWYMVPYGAVGKLSQQEFIDVVEQPRLGFSIGDYINGETLGDTEALLNEKDMQWLDVRRHEYSVAKGIAIGVSICCAALIIFGMVLYWKAIRKNMQIGIHRYKSYLYVLFVIYAGSTFFLPTILGLCAIYWIRQNEAPYLKHNDTFTWFGLGSMVIAALHSLFFDLVDMFKILHPFHLFASWLPEDTDDGLLSRVMTPSGIGYMEREVYSDYKRYEHGILLSFALLVLLAGILMSWIQRRKMQKAKETEQK